jgi:hypothetical protein
MNMKLSENIKRLFWDMDTSKLDTKKYKEVIIERVLNAGSLNDWKWLVANYGTAAIRARLSKKSVLDRDNIRPESRRLASLILK